MILVDSTVTITTHNAVVPGDASAAALSQSGRVPDLPTKTPVGRSAGTLAKLALGAALTASGAGAGFGIPLLFSGGTDVVEKVITAPATSSVASPSSGWTLELGGGR